MSYEGKMARASLRKTAMYSTELLKMIGINSELDAWVQDKISQIDHNIESVYGYYKFGEKEEKVMALKESQRSLKNWTKQKWQYSSDKEQDKPKSDRGRNYTLVLKIKPL